MHIRLITCFKVTEDDGGGSDGTRFAARDYDENAGPIPGSDAVAAADDGVFKGAGPVPGSDAITNATGGDICLWLANAFNHYDELPSSSLLKHHFEDFFLGALEDKGVQASLAQYAADRTDTNCSFVAKAWRRAYEFEGETFIQCTLTRDTFVFARSSFTEGYGRDEGFLMTTATSTNDRDLEATLSAALYEPIESRTLAEEWALCR